ncbi:MAG: rhomboid family intramembrane serine protease [Solirubrobacteraceae bacterium]
MALILANFCVWIFYELPHLNSAVYHASFYACTVNSTCHGPEPWQISWFTAMFMHGSWDHILGNMLFLAVFGKNVEDSFGRLRYLAFYIAGGFVANATQTAVTLLAGSAASARVPMLGVRRLHAFCVIRARVPPGRSAANHSNHVMTRHQNGAEAVWPELLTVL